MKFQCETCAAKYVIPDERVAGRFLRVRCKRCREIMEVLGPRQTTGAHSSAPPSWSQQDVATDQPMLSAHGTSSDPFVAAGGSGVWGLDGTPADLDHTEDGLQVTARLKPVVPPPLPSEHADGAQWYVSIQSQPRGPFTQDEMRLLAARGRVHTRTRVWRTGMASWVRLEECPALGFLHRVVRSRTDIRKLPPPVPPVLDELSGMQMAPPSQSSHSIRPIEGTAPARPFHNLLESGAGMPDVPHTPAPFGSFLPAMAHVGGTGWFVITPEGVTRVLEQTPTRHAPGTTPMVTGSHLLAPPGRRMGVTAVGLCALALVLGALALLPVLTDLSGAGRPAVQDITARSPLDGVGELKAGTDAEQLEQIRALGAAPPAQAAPAPKPEPRVSLSSVTQAIRKKAQALLGN